MNTQTIILTRRPVGLPEVADFALVTETLPAIRQGEVLLEALYISVDPYLRARMAGNKQPRFELGQPVASKIIARVVQSLHPGFRVGTLVSHYLQWKTFQVSDGTGLSEIETAGLPPTAFLGLLGITGLSAYLSLQDIGKLKAGETLVVSGAAGAVGSIAGQIGKILGCRVVGIVGSDEKAALVTGKFGFDAAINYRTTHDLPAAIRAACPAGVDVYFDNVGGSISDAVLGHMNAYGRIIACGAIANYNDQQQALSPSILPLVVYKFLTIRGFLIADYAPLFAEALVVLKTWLAEGKLTYSETVIDGFENLPQAFMGLFTGLNQGKMIVRC